MYILLCYFTVKVNRFELFDAVFDEARGCYPTVLSLVRGIMYIAVQFTYAVLARCMNV